MRLTRIGLKDLQGHTPLVKNQNTSWYNRTMCVYMEPCEVSTPTQLHCKRVRRTKSLTNKYHHGARIGRLHPHPHPLPHAHGHGRGPSVSPEETSCDFEPGASTPECASLILRCGTIMVKMVNAKSLCRSCVVLVLSFCLFFFFSKLFFFLFLSFKLLVSRWLGTAGPGQK